MHPGQLEMLMKFKDDCICIDGTHSLNPYQFELTTLLIVDDMREGFPCYFMFSNRSYEEIMIIFFEEINKKLNKPIQPNIFMSDMAEYYFTAWVKVMSPPKLRFLFKNCTWHIDRAWRNNLNKLQRQELKKDVYRQLRTLLQERDPEAFPIMLNNFVQSMLSSAESNEFGRYFKQYYVENAVAWAYCYRRGAGINTNMHIERTHQTIKYIYLEGKSVQRLDKTIHILMKFVNDKLFDRLISMNKGKITSKITELRKRHKNSQNMNITSVTQSEMGWNVPSSSTGEIYLIQEQKINCNCKLSCSLCEACLHAYSCSCLDNSIRWNMCKHTHLVCQYKKSVGRIA
nr:unnamed protein product [Callosobruchus analis]